MSENMDRIIEKISKLLAMANDSSSPNEAMIAARRARALMDKHQLEVSDIEAAKGSQFLELKYELNGSRTPKWMVSLASASSSLNDCRVLRQRGIYDTNMSFVFQGFKADTIVAKLTFEYFVEACERQLERLKLKGASKRNFFRLGFAQQVSYRYALIVNERQQTMVSSTGTALIPLKMSQIIEYFGETGTYKPAPTRNASSEEIAAYMRGVEQGKQLGLDPQVEGERAKALKAQKEKEPSQ